MNKFKKIKSLLSPKRRPKGLGAKVKAWAGTCKKGIGPRGLCALLCCALLLPLAGCGKSPSLLRYDIPKAPQSLDPQFATGTVEQMVIQNICEGLVRQLPSGEIVLALAEDYTVSENGRVYTFFLREDVQWENNDPVTAEDFVFAFQRMFNAVSLSPYAEEFLSISGARQIIESGADASILGVKASDSHTLVFTLTKADPSFLEQLCRPAAMPCNQKFFEESRGKYGTTAEMVLANGPFFIRLWNNESHLYLKRNSHYYDAQQVQLPGVYLYIRRDAATSEQIDSGEAPLTIYERVLEGSADIAPASYQQAMAAQQQGCAYQKQSNTVWGLVANPKNQVLSMDSMRRAFFHCISRVELEGYLQKNMTMTNRLISPEVMQFAQRYTASTNVNVDVYLPQQAQEEYEAALPQANRSALESLELLVPDEANIPFMSGMMQQMWERTLSSFVNIVALPREELESRVAAGDYDMAIVPFSSTENTPLEVMGQFYSGGGQTSRWGYDSEEYNALYVAAQEAKTEETRMPALEQAETYLYQDCAVVPLFYETTYIVFAPGVSGVEIYPYGDMVYFKNAVAYR